MDIQKCNRCWGSGREFYEDMQERSARHVIRVVTLDCRKKNSRQRSRKPWRSEQSPRKGHTTPAGSVGLDSFFVSRVSNRARTTKPNASGRIRVRRCQNAQLNDYDYYRNRFAPLRKHTPSHNQQFLFSRQTPSKRLNSRELDEQL